MKSERVHVRKNREADEKTIRAGRADQHLRAEKTIGGAEMHSHALQDVFNPIPAKTAPGAKEGPASVGFEAAVRR